ncbi:hypothetical protein ATANTOWER_027346 [Ataeniobius toweri]|uniref:Uncharacterized protein n=1 Tax=Ataeniobius toweri TaxID=208326 RepID=A0ABU7B3E8_9TELE|nr:hypothetical protein [Ataeniobius toweri]
MDGKIKSSSDMELEPGLEAQHCTGTEDSGRMMQSLGRPNRHCYGNGEYSAEALGTLSGDCIGLQNCTIRNRN